MTSRKSQYAFLLRGYAHAPITDVRVVDCTFDGVAEPDVLEAVRDLALTNVRINGQLRNETDHAGEARARSGQVVEPPGLSRPHECACAMSDAATGGHRERSSRPAKWNCHLTCQFSKW